MAASDYTLRGDGGLCPYAELADAITEGTLSITIENYQEVGGASDLEVGMGLMVGEEIMRLEFIDMPNLTVARGCADTIPAAHPVNTPIWFFTQAAASDEREYMATDEIAVKVLPYSLSDGPVPVENAPPHDLVFNWRFSRPYAPGLFLVQGQPWYSDVFEFDDDDTEFVLTWVHRDRLLQGDQLISHGEASIGPEAGTTYTVRIYDETNALVREELGITGETWSYDKTDAMADVPSGVGRLVLCSTRETLDSWQKYTVRFRPFPGGLGEALGENLGG